MAEYIERESVYNTLKAMYCDECTDEKCQMCEYAEIMFVLDNLPIADVQPVDKDNMHIIYIGRKAYLAENTIMEFMKKMDIIRDSLAHIENYFDTYAETIRQINACVGRCTDITEVKYFINRIKENSGYD